MNASIYIISISISISMYLYMHIYMKTYIFTYIYTYTYIWGRVTYIWGREREIYVYIYTCLCIYQHVYMYMYIHIHTYTYIHICTFTHAHIHTHRTRRWLGFPFMRQTCLCQKIEMRQVSYPQTSSTPGHCHPHTCYTTAQGDNFFWTRELQMNFLIFFFFKFLASCLCRSSWNFSNVNSVVILHSKLSSELTCENFHRLGLVWTLR